MHTVRIPKVIQFGENALSEADYPKNALVVTTAPPKLSGKWLDRMGIQAVSYTHLTLPTILLV